MIEIVAIESGYVILPNYIDERVEAQIFVSQDTFFWHTEVASRENAYAP